MPVAGPAVRAWQGLACVDELGRLLVQQVLVFKRLALVRDRCCGLGGESALGEQRRRLLVGAPLNGSSDGDLLQGLAPVERHRSERGAREVLALAAAEVRAEVHRTAGDLLTSPMRLSGWPWASTVATASARGSRTSCSAAMPNQRSSRPSGSAGGASNAGSSRHSLPVRVLATSGTSKGMSWECRRSQMMVGRDQ